MELKHETGHILHLVPQGQRFSNSHPRCNKFVIGNIEEGEILVKIKYLPIDLFPNPQTAAALPSFPTSMNGESFQVQAIAEVIGSRDERFNKGDLIESPLPLAEYCIVKADGVHLIRSADLPAATRKVIGKLLHFEEITINTETMEVYYGTEQVELTRKEYLLLKLLMENPEKVYSRDELLDKVWGYECYPVTRTVDNHILHLRKKLAKHLFETVRGTGYRLTTGKS